MSRHYRLYRFATLGLVIGLLVAPWFFPSSLCIAAASSPADGEAEIPRPLIAAVPRNFPPHYRVMDDGAVTGFAIEAMDAIAARAGLEIQYRAYPDWQAVLNALRSGEADLVPNLGITEDRQAFADFTAPLEEFDVVFFRLRGEAGSRAIPDLSTLRTGVVAGNAAVLRLTEGKGPDPLVFDDPQRALDALLNGAIDLFAYPEPALLKLAAQQGVEHRLEVVGPLVQRVRRGIAVAKGRSRLLALLDDAVHQYTSTPAYSTLYRKWYGAEFQHWYYAKNLWIFIAIVVLGLALVAMNGARRSGLGFWDYLLRRTDDPIVRKLHFRTIALVLVMVATAIIIASATLFLVYQVSFEEQRQRLVELARSQAHLFEAVAQFDRRHSRDFPGGSELATLSQITQALARPLGETEFILARQDGDRLIYIVRQHAWDRYRPSPVPAASELAEPMRLALGGGSGTLVAKDYRGVTVLAAYEPVSALNLGVVVKMDLDLFRQPFIEAALVALGLTVLILLAGMLSIRRLAAPLIQDILDRERWFRTIFEHAGIGVALVDSLSGRFLKINRRYCEVLGYTEGEMKAMDFQRLTHPDDLDAALDHMERMRAGEIRGFSLEKRYRRKDGAWVWVTLTVSPTWAPGARPDCHIATMDDITQRKAAEETLMRFFEQDMNLHLIAGLDGVMRRLNQGWQRVLGYAPEELEGTPFFDFVHPDDLQATRAEMAKLRRGEPIFYFENRYRRKDGGYRLLAWSSVSSVEDGSVYAVASDITEQRENEHERAKLDAQLSRAQKMEAIGELSGGIAHDFNNILGILIGNLDLLETQTQDNPETLKRLSAMRRAAERAAKLTRQLLSFSRRHATETAPTDLNHAIEEMTSLIERSLTPRIEVTHRLAADLWLTEVDPGGFQDALLNLVINARDAMPEGGRLILETANQELDAAYAALNPGLRAGEYVVLAVTDTGEGISPEAQERVFEPFFSTKAKERGTGLGLAMVYGFVKRSGGYIKVYSELGQGAAFRLYLPRSQAPEARHEHLAESLAEPLPRGDETILVVDDEPELMELAAGSLKALGYRVLTAGNGPQAVAALERTSIVDLLFSDVVMPGGMNGYALAERAEALHPEIRVLLSSGFTDGAAARSGQSRFNVGLLSKPYTQAELALRVREILGPERTVPGPMPAASVEAPPADELLLLGIDAIDQDHQGLTELFEQARSAEQQGDLELEIETLRRLSVLAPAHFRREEAIMAACGYPGLANHRQVHHLLLREIALMQRQADGGDPPAPGVLAAFLESWLVEHVRILDGAYARYCQGQEERIREVLEALDRTGRAP